MSDPIDDMALELLAYLRGYDDSEVLEKCGLTEQGEDDPEYIADCASDLAYVTSKLRDAASNERSACNEDWRASISGYFFNKPSTTLVRISADALERQRKRDEETRP